MGDHVRVERLVKRFGRHVALDDVNFRLDAGQAALLTGANGSGKSTLLRILATLSRPTSGRVLLAGRPGVGAQARLRLGFAGHHPLVYEDLSARENLVLVARVAGMEDWAAQAAAADWLDRFGLATWADEPAGALSRGMLQRVAVARAMVTQPPLLLLDEPATALDDEHRAVLRQLLDDARGRQTVIVAAHDRTTFEGWADRRFSLYRGRLAEVEV